MDTWTLVAAAAGLSALALPIIVRISGKGETPEARELRRARQRAILGEFDEIVAPLLRESSPEAPVRVGPGSELYERYMAVRKKMRFEFRSSTGMNFDREIGYDLNRPGTIVPATVRVLEQVQKGRQTLLAEIDE